MASEQFDNRVLAENHSDMKRDTKCQTWMRIILRIFWVHVSRILGVYRSFCGAQLLGDDETVEVECEVSRSLYKS